MWWLFHTFCTANIIFGIYRYELSDKEWLDSETKVFCRKNNQIHFPMVKKYFSQKYPKCSKIYQPNLSAQAQKFGISMKKLGVRSPCIRWNMDQCQNLGDKLWIRLVRKYVAMYILCTYMYMYVYMYKSNLCMRAHGLRTPGEEIAFTAPHGWNSLPLPNS